MAGRKDSEKRASLPLGAVISEPGSTTKTKTGGWRSFRPVLIKEQCKKCGKCWLVCPEGAIKKMADGSFGVDYDYCKGCLLCVKECQFKAIKSEVEEK